MILELFSGNGNITKAFNNRGHYCVSVDYDETKDATIHMNVYEMTREDFKMANFIWLSPDCTTYSIAQHGIHRGKGGVAVSNYAKECDINNENLISLLIDLDIPFIVENPRGHMRQMKWMQSLHRITIYYSTYGNENTKPTDLWSNREELLDCFDTKISRGSKLTEQISYRDFLGRCKMPQSLIDNIVDAYEMVVMNNEEI